jgi:hypothetical protein
MYGVTLMIDKQCATEIRDLALKSIMNLSQILQVIRGRCTEQEYEKLKKGVGLSVGKIQIDILDVVYITHPDLDDLK